MNEAFLVGGVILLLTWMANGLVLRMRNWHRPSLLAFGLVGSTAALAALVLPQVTHASQSVLVPVAWIALISLLIKLAVLGRMRGLRLGAPSAVLAWIAELVTLLAVSIAILMGVLRQ